MHGDKELFLNNNSASNYVFSSKYFKMVILSKSLESFRDHSQTVKFNPRKKGNVYCLKRIISNITMYRWSLIFRVAYQLLDRCLDGFNVWLEPYNGLLITVWKTLLKFFREHAITICIVHRRDIAPVSQVLLDPFAKVSSNIVVTVNRYNIQKM